MNGHRQIPDQIIPVGDFEVITVLSCTGPSIIVCPCVSQKVLHLHIPVGHLIIGDLVDILPVEAVLPAVLHFVHALPSVPYGNQLPKLLVIVHGAGVDSVRNRQDCAAAFPNLAGQC